MSDHKILYWIVGGGLALLLVVMLISYNYDKANTEAQQKAEELIAAYEAAGLATPLPADSLAEVLGDDGGAVCSAIGDHRAIGYLKTRLGVGGEFYFRPTRVDRNTIKGLVLVAEVYCPENLPDAQDLYDALRFASVVRG